MPPFYEHPTSSLPAPRDCNPDAGSRGEGEANCIEIFVGKLQIGGDEVARDPALVGVAGE